MTGLYRDSASERSVAALQAWLFERVTRPAEWHPEPAERAKAEADAARFVVGGLLPASDRIEIYRRGYWSRLVECLGDDYPAVAHALGPGAFHELCLDFIEAHPPASASLNFYGAPFAAFCATHANPSRAFISELARLEWAVVEAIHADADSAIDLGALASASPFDAERLRLEPSPALRVLASAYPVHDYYRAYLDDESPTLPAPAPTITAVCRRGDDIWRVVIEPEYAALLEQLREGTPLVLALESIEAGNSADAETRAADLQRTLSQWVACGFFSAVLAV